jgi:hypothetical protein
MRKGERQVRRELEMRKREKIKVTTQMRGGKGGAGNNRGKYMVREQRRMKREWMGGEERRRIVREVRVTEISSRSNGQKILECEG